MTEFPDDADGQALRRAAEHADMCRPMNIDFAVVLPNEAAGIQFANEALKHGYSTSLDHDEQTDSWTCYCTREMLATYEGVVTAQQELDQLSAPFGGSSDGWGTFGNSDT